MKSTGLTHATKFSLLSAGLIALIVIAEVIIYYLIHRYVGHVQSQWCDTLRLLTVNKINPPANPAQNPSRVEAYQLYTDFVQLRNQFGCTP